MSDIVQRIVYEGVQEGVVGMEQLVRVIAQLEAQTGEMAAAEARLEGAFESEGAESAQLRAELDRLKRKKQETTEQTGSLGQAATGLGSKWGQLAGAAGALGSSLGTLTPIASRAGGALGAIGSASSQMTSSMGPAGAAIAGVTTVVSLASIAYQIYSDMADDAAAATHELGSEARAANVSMQELISTIQASNRERARQSRVALGLGSRAEQEAATERADRKVTQLQASIASLEAERESFNGNSFGGMRAQQDFDRSNEERLALMERQLAGAQGEAREARRLQELASREEGQDLQRQLTAPAGGRRSGGGRSARDTSAQDAEREAERLRLAAMAAEREMEARIAAEVQENVDREIALLEKAAEAESDRKEREREEIEINHRKRMEAIEEERDAAQRAQEDRAEQMQEITGELHSQITSVASAYNSAFQEAIEGTKSFEEAMLDATKIVLKGIGDEMVGLGIKAILEGATMVVTNPPGAATKIGGGVALVAGGVALGAGAAAIPSAPAAPPESPREDSGGGGGGDVTLVQNLNSPIMTAQTNAALARQMRRTAGLDRTFSAGGDS